YAVSGHRHAPEVEQALGREICFVPHLLPVRRGLLATCYADCGGADARALLASAYAASEDVRVLPEGVVPGTARVHGTEAGEVGGFANGDTSVAVGAIDSLGKGAAGQAV